MFKRVAKVSKTKAAVKTYHDRGVIILAVLTWVLGDGRKRAHEVKWSSSLTLCSRLCGAEIKNGRMAKAFNEWLLINSCEAGGRWKYEEESAPSVARSTANGANFLSWQRHNGSSDIEIDLQHAHKAYALAVSPDRLCKDCQPIKLPLNLIVPVCTLC